MPESEFFCALYRFRRVLVCNCLALSVVVVCTETTAVAERREIHCEGLRIHHSLLLILFRDASGRDEERIGACSLGDWNEVEGAGERGVVHCQCVKLEVLGHSPSRL